MKLPETVMSIALLAFALASCVHTSQFRDASGDVLPRSIATMEMQPIGGISQSLWFRGENTENPALVLLHGGPGASESALFRHFDAKLEQQYLVVYWEQRGAGRSFDPDIPTDSMTVARLIADLDEVVDLVRCRFGKSKVVLLGHSWVTVLGRRAPGRCPQVTQSPATSRAGDEMTVGREAAQTIAG